jgi:bifunctional non-homologous end joining protein LigD
MANRCFRTCSEVELGRDHLEAGRCSVPLGAQRELAEDQGRPHGQVSCCWFVKDPTGVAALYLGNQEGIHLVYMGKVGAGWSRAVSSQFRKQLDTVVSPKSKRAPPIRKPKATWVEPQFYADIEYRDITSEGLLRASSFKGLSRE